MSNMKVEDEAETREIKQEQNKEKRPLTKEESDYMEKVFFEEDDTVRLRDGITYKIPPLGLLDGKNLMKKLNTIDTGIIISNLIADESGEDHFEELLEVLLMAFKPYYKEITADYLANYVDIHTAKQIIDIMIGLNGIKKSL
ncbi:DNA polymerase III subunit gamma/tau [Bacillus chungangensis]